MFRIMRSARRRSTPSAECRETQKKKEERYSSRESERERERLFVDRFDTSTMPSPGMIMPREAPIVRLSRSADDADGRRYTRLCSTRRRCEAAVTNPPGYRHQGVRWISGLGLFGRRPLLRQEVFLARSLYCVLRAIIIITVVRG